MARSGFDHLVCGQGSVLLHYLFAAVQEADVAIEQWLVSDAKASGLGTGCAFQAFTMWKLLSALEFASMAGARNISWQSVEACIRASPVSFRMSHVPFQKYHVFSRASHLIRTLLGYVLGTRWTLIVYMCKSS